MNQLITESYALHLLVGQSLEGVRPSDPLGPRGLTYEPPWLIIRGIWELDRVQNLMGGLNLGPL